MLSTDDMVNWTYHGLIDVKALSPWGIASWAPSIVSRVESDGKTYAVSQFTQGLGHCRAPFDPGAVIDDEGTGWLSFGGGGKREVGTDYMPALSAWAKT
jgi:arabinoxylan arabinofuranohydrolase